MAATHTFDGHTFEVRYTDAATAAAALAKLTKQVPRSARPLDPDVQMELSAMLGESGGGGAGGYRMSPTLDRQRINGSPTTTARKPAPRLSTVRKDNGLNSPRTKPSSATPPPPAQPPPPAPPPPPADTSAARHELEALMRKPAHTAEDRYRVLDARDKLIRLTTAPTTDLARAVTTRGLCPDLCPEKERLMREATHHIATFELESNATTMPHSKQTLRHALALKQYSRSSADQESPLAHELRPEPILELTMSLLLHRIVDRCDDADTNLADWFHFVWDRTRSIRKDISQQELCSAGAVRLVEQCARLHIHCAGRLVAEEPAVFDSRINSENLTKCLQSLKYMYHDLQEVHGGARCASEPEFRAYVILLNLNDGQFFWELKRLPAAVRQSAEVRFALQVYTAIETSNYVRFFRLVRRTTYMNACILLRYFTQVRLVALQTMLKAYAPRQAVPMALSYWRYVLAFEDDEQTAQFFEYYGMRCDRDEDRVMLDRTALFYPETPIWPERAVNVVEHKRVCSVGQAIWGSDGEMPEFEGRYAAYVPHESFGPDGRLRAAAWLAEDQHYLRPRRRRAEEEVEEERCVELTKVMEEEQVEEEERQRSESEEEEDDEYEHDGGDRRRYEHENNSEDEDYVEDDNENGMYARRVADEDEAPTATSVFKMPALPLPPSSSSNQPMFTADKQPTSATSASIFGGSAFGASSSSVPSTTVDGIFAAQPNSSVGNIFGPSSNVFGGSAAFSLPGLTAVGAATAAPTTTTTNGSIFGSAARFAPVAADQSQFAAKPASIFGGSAVISAKPARYPHADPSHSASPAHQPPATAPPSSPPPPLRRRDSLDREQRALDARLAVERAHFAAHLHTTATQLADDLLTAAIHRECVALCTAAALECQAVHRHAIHLATELLAETLKEHVLHAAQQTLVETEQRSHQQTIAAKFLQRWRAIVQRRRRQREYLAVTPLWITADVDRALHVPAELRAPQQREALEQRRRYRLGALASPSRVAPSPRIVQPQPPIDVCALVAAAAAASNTNTGKPRFWKCLLSLPASSDRLQKWLSGVFHRRSATTTDVLFCERHCGPTDRLPTAVCLRTLLGDALNDCITAQPATAPQLAGASAAIFFMSALEPAADTQRRLRRLQKLRLPLDIVLHQTRTDRVDLRTLAERFVIAGRVHGATGDAGGLRELTSSAIQHLVRTPTAAAPQFTELRMQRTASFLRHTLGDQLWVQLAQSAHTNAAMRAAIHNADRVRGFFNEALRRLYAMCAHNRPQYAACADFAPEFRQFVPFAGGAAPPDIPLTSEYFPANWKSPRRGQQLAAFFAGLALRPAVELGGGGDVDAVTVRRYVEEHFASAGGECDAAATASRVLCSVRQQQMGTDRICWLQPMQVLCTMRLQAMFAECSTGRQLPAEIVYDGELLRAFGAQPWWLNVLAEQEKQQQQQQHQHRIDVTARIPAPAAVRRIDPTMLDELMQRGRELLDRADASIEGGRQAVARQPKWTAVTVQRGQKRRQTTERRANGGDDQDDDDDDASAENAPANGVETAVAAIAGMSAKKSRHSNGRDGGGGDDDLAAILARGRARLERAERTIEKFYTT